MHTEERESPALFHSIVPMELREFKMFRELIHHHAGIWLHDGKQVMLASRLSRRLRHHGLSSFADYYSHVQSANDGGGELRELINCVTTNKTSFFREEHHFEFLSRTVIPEIQRAVGRGAPKSVRIWSAACSTGEEPYTIAISVLEALGKPIGTLNTTMDLQTSVASNAAACAIPQAWKIEIIASDIDTVVLNTAARALYPMESLDTVASSFRGKYFLRGKGEMLGRVRVKPQVARLVQFKRINLMENPWPLDGLFDAVFFRNALIYFNQETQELFLRKMVRYLKPRGYLFLGHSEHVPWLQDVVVPLKKTVYQLREPGQAREGGF